MASWSLTKGMANLLAQIDEAFPDRDHASDGTIGDTAHQAEKSGHNPDRTANAEYKDGDALNEVRAIDVDSDFRAAPATAQQVVDHIRALPGVGNVLRYMIYNRKIYRASNGWKPEAYTGASAHTEHIHFSGQFTQAADNNTTFDYRLEEIPVALTASDKAWISQEITAAVNALVTATPLNGADGKPDGTSSTPVGHNAFNQGIPSPFEADGGRVRAYVLLGQIAEHVKALVPPAKPTA